MEKPGWKTTEFWLTLAASLVGLIYMSGLVQAGSDLDKWLAAAVSILATLGYQVARSTVKVKSNKAADKR